MPQPGSSASSSIPIRRNTGQTLRGNARSQEDDEAGLDLEEEDEEDVDDDHDHVDGSEMLNEVTVKAGYLWKKGEKRKTWKKRWFVLRSSKLCYYKNEKEYQLLRYIDMADVHSIAAIELKGRDNTFGIVTPRRAYYVKARDRAEMEEWTQALNDVKTQMSQRNTMTSEMADLSMTPSTRVRSNVASDTSPSSSQQGRQHASSQSAISRAATSAAAATPASGGAVSINIPGKGHYTSPAQPRAIPSSGDAFSPLTATTDSDTGAEQYGLSYTSSTGYSHSLGSSPGREAYRSGPELSEGSGSALGVGRRSSNRERSSHREAGGGSSAGGSARGSFRRSGVPVIVGGSDSGPLPSSSYQNGGGIPVLSSSDEDDDDDEQLDQAMPLPSMAATLAGATAQPNSEGSASTATDEASAAPTATGPPTGKTARETGDFLKDPDRIIMQSYLMKQSKGRNQWRKRWFVLTASRLVYTRSHMNKKALREIGIASILDAIEFSAPSSSSASQTMGSGSPNVPSPLGGTFNFNAFGSGAGDGAARPHDLQGTALSGVTMTGEDDGGRGETAPTPNAAVGSASAAGAPLSPPLRRHSVVAAAAGMASTLGAGVGIERDGTSKKKMDNCFKIITPKRVYLLCAPTEEEEIKWLSALQALLARTRGSKKAVGTTSAPGSTLESANSSTSHPTASPPPANQTNNHVLGSQAAPAGSPLLRSS